MSFDQHEEAWKCSYQRLTPLGLMYRILYIGYFWREPKTCQCTEFCTLALQVEFIVPRLKPHPDARRGCLTALWDSFGFELAQVCMGALGTRSAGCLLAFPPVRGEGPQCKTVPKLRM